MTNNNHPSTNQSEQLSQRRDPQFLTASHGWCGTRLEQDPRFPDDPHKKTKKPRSIVTDELIDVFNQVDPSMLVSYELAAEALRAEKVDAIGYCVTGSTFIILDFDHCFDANGDLKSWGRQILELTGGTYVEYSQSKTGLHVIVHVDRKFKATFDAAKLIYNVKGDQDGGKVEIFLRGWVALTGIPFGDFHEVERMSNDNLTALISFCDTLKGSVTEEVRAEAGVVLRPKTKELLSLDPKNSADVSASVHSAVVQLLIDTVLDEKKAEELFKTSLLYQKAWGIGEKKWERLRNDELKKARPFAQNALRAMLRGRAVPDAVTIDASTWPAEYPVGSDYAEEDTSTKAIIADLMIAEADHLWSGPPGSFKTMAYLEMIRALTARDPELRKTFGYFPVIPPDPVPCVFVQADMPHNLFLQFARYFGLLEPEVGDLFRFRSLKHGDAPSYDDARLMKAVEGRVLFGDSYFDLFGGKDEKDPEEHRRFFQQRRRLIEHCGCLAINTISHSTKAGANPDAPIEQSSSIRGAITIAAKADVAFGAKYVEEKGRVFVVCTKPRAFEKPPQPFSLAPYDEDGNSNISKGSFPICDRPGEISRASSGGKKAGRPEDTDKALKTKLLVHLRKQNPDANNDKLATLFAQRFSQHKKMSGKTVERWLKEYDQADEAAIAQLEGSEQIPF